MKVAVLARPEDGEEVLAVLDILRSLSIHAYGLKIGATWAGADRPGLSARIERASHLLVLASAANDDLAWFHFVTGYGIGKAARLSLYRLVPSWEPPAFLARIPILDGREELSQYFSIEGEEWATQEGRRLARTTLLEIGISAHADSFASCVAEGNAQAVELFLKAGFPANSRDKHGVPMLCLAARNRGRAIAGLLLDYGAEIDLQSEDRGYSALMDAAHGGSAELVGLLLDRGANPNLLSKDSQTALILAVGRSDAEIAARLLSGGADPDIADKLGLSARKYASLFKKPDLLALFETPVEALAT